MVSATDEHDDTEFFAMTNVLEVSDSEESNNFDYV